MIFCVVHSESSGMVQRPTPPTNQALYASAAYESKQYIALMYPQEP